jgi:hypothetical protein
MDSSIGSGDITNGICEWSFTIPISNQWINLDSIELIGITPIYPMPTTIIRMTNGLQISFTFFAQTNVFYTLHGVTKIDPFWFSRSIYNFEGGAPFTYPVCQYGLRKGSDMSTGRRIGIYSGSLFGVGSNTMRTLTFVTDTNDAVFYHWQAGAY